VTSPRFAAVRSSCGAAIATVALVLVSGCDLGHPGGFTARTESYCAQYSTQLSKLDQPKTLTTPKAQLQYAIDRYTDIERLVSVFTDASLPGGKLGQQLRAQWLRPARASLLIGRTVLAQLRVAANTHDVSQANAAFSRSLAIGTQGVDTTLLRAQGLTTCSQVFQPTAV
jgi:hypothetical protein